MTHKYPLSITELKGLRPVLGNNFGENIKRYQVLKELFSEGNAHFTFAEPSLMAGKIHWETELKGEIIPLARLPLDVLEKVKRVMRYYLDLMYEALKQYEDADTLRRTLNNCIEIPDENCIFLVGKRPVLTNWGFLHDAMSAKKQILQSWIQSIAPPKIMLNLKAVEIGTETPLSDTRIEVCFNKMRLEMLTNQEGNVSFQTIQPYDQPIFEIKAIKEGYEIAEKTIQSEHTVAEIIFNGNFPFISVLKLKRKTIVIEPKPLPPPPVVETADVLVKVIDKQTRRPLPNAVVTLFNNQFSEHKTADTEGVLVFRNAPILNKLITYTTLDAYGDERCELLAPNLRGEVTVIEMTAIAQGGLRGKRGDLSVTLQWQTIDDLDLHVIDPFENHIYFGKPEIKHGDSLAQLDVDANLKDHEVLTNPQENIYWKGALTGTYQVIVNNYKSRTLTAVPFTIIISKPYDRTELTGRIEPDSEPLLVTSFFYQE